MATDEGLIILGREWDKLRSIFEMCGDIGNLNPDDLNETNSPDDICYQGFLENVFRMNELIPQDGYKTPEAYKVFTLLASIAAEKLGLDKSLSYTFGLGFGFVRTGYVSYDRLEPKQAIFHKMFFPLGGEWNLEWDFDQSFVKERLKLVFNTFKSWQNNPDSYENDLELFQSQGKSWKAWDES